MATSKSFKSITDRIRRNIAAGSEIHVYNTAPLTAALTPCQVDWPTGRSSSGDGDDDPSEGVFAIGQTGTRDDRFVLASLETHSGLTLHSRLAVHLRPTAPAVNSATSTLLIQPMPTPISSRRTRRVTIGPRKRPQKGFTILEVMLAATVMVFAISTSILTLRSAFLAIDTARNVTLAGQIMMTEMEKMRLADWSMVSSYPATSTTLLVDPNFTGNPRIGQRFTLTRTAAVVGGNANLLELSYTATWTGQDRRTHQRTYTTYYARHGIRDYLYNTS